MEIVIFYSVPLLVADNIAYCTYHYLGGDGYVEKKSQNYLFEKKNIRIDVFLTLSLYSRSRYPAYFEHAFIRTKFKCRL